ncbi:MAG: glycosyl transferase family 2 [Pseudozobellia sp.]|nr:glycosyl transferase family 2 [Pseudozobellia sp.]MBG49182.1 glycosyl transferase family 2 [Pseudozobellia sp.]|tara:strand:- start:228 stop:992 length:765 start_codon:yes stop_codon:yes gene_type:complete
MLTAAIVLYHNDPVVLMEAVDSFLATPMRKILYLIDNSNTNSLESYFQGRDEVVYIHTGKNVGFGAGHNHILKDIASKSDYHLILNPDAYFDKEVIPLLVKQLKSDSQIGIIAPKILYADGTFQHSIRRFPRVYDFLLRRVKFLGKLFKNAFDKINYLNGPIDRPLDVEAVSGCFQLFRTSVFLGVKGFDTRYFMYMEDLDICREVHKMGYKVLYYPDISVFHRSEYASKKSMKLFRIHLQSIFRYFVKWGIKV